MAITEGWVGTRTSVRLVAVDLSLVGGEPKWEPSCVRSPCFVWCSGGLLSQDWWMGAAANRWRIALRRVAVLRPRALAARGSCCRRGAGTVGAGRFVALGSPELVQTAVGAAASPRNQRMVWVAEFHISFANGSSTERRSLRASFSEEKRSMVCVCGGQRRVARRRLAASARGGKRTDCQCKKVPRIRPMLAIGRR